jgi:hypothetical protein
LKYIGVDERIILKGILKKCSVRMWSDLTQGSVYWTALVKRKISGFHRGLCLSLLAKRLSDS